MLASDRCFDGIVHRNIIDVLSSISASCDMDCDIIDPPLRRKEHSVVESSVTAECKGYHGTGTTAVTEFAECGKSGCTSWSCSAGI